MAYSLAQIAHEFSLDYEGDGDLQIAGLCGLSDNLADHLSFVADKKMLAIAEASNMSAFVTLRDCAVNGKTNLFHADPNYAIAKIAQLYAKPRFPKSMNRHPSAVIDATASISESAVIGANVVIGADAKIGQRSTISAGCIISERVEIGEDCMFHANSFSNLAWSSVAMALATSGINTTTSKSRSSAMSSSKPTLKLAQTRASIGPVLLRPESSRDQRSITAW
jgi:UDP-3-O-[3-hydroxymyristoyl] glucosamine N-acyltransferase